jgi:hypothetical protein
MNNHTSPCDHMIFVAKSSLERTQVPRRVTDRLMVRRLVNINPVRPRTSSTTAPRKPQHHHLQSPRSESKSFSFLKQAHGIKRSVKEAGGEVLSTPPAEPEEVPPPPLEEVKRLKPPRRKVPPPMRAPSVNVEDAYFSVKMPTCLGRVLKRWLFILGSNDLVSRCRRP